MAISSVLGFISYFHIFSSAIISEATPIFVLLSRSCTMFHCHKLPLLVMKLKAKDMGKKIKKKLTFPCVQRIPRFLDLGTSWR
jgi:hypothetical protein